MERYRGFVFRYEFGIFVLRMIGTKLPVKEYVGAACSCDEEDHHPENCTGFSLRRVGRHVFVNTRGGEPDTSLDTKTHDPEKDTTHIILPSSMHVENFRKEIDGKTFGEILEEDVTYGHDLRPLKKKHSNGKKRDRRKKDRRRK